jgi:uncharacterized protein YndB with AHSA1/START domain
MSDATREHSHELTIDAPPERVWRAITTADELVRWFPLDAKAQPGAGGALTYSWGKDFTGRCEIVAWEPPAHLRTTWMEAAPSAEASEAERRRLLVDWTLEARGGRTVLRLVHSGFGRDAKWDDEYDGTRRGWEFELRSLRHYLERHPDHARSAFWLRQSVSCDAREAWRRFVTHFLGGARIESLCEGERYEAALQVGETLSGEVFFALPPTDFAGTVRSWNDAVFRYGYERFATPEVTLWLSVWGEPPFELAALQERWQQALREAFAPGS